MSLKILWSKKNIWLEVCELQFLRVEEQRVEQEPEVLHTQGEGKLPTEEVGRWRGSSPEKKQQSFPPVIVIPTSTQIFCSANRER